MYQMSERWDVETVSRFMADPQLYWAINDRLSPQPEQLNWPEYLSRPDVATYVATFYGNIVGYVQFLRRTMIGAEMTVAFRENHRGKVAKTLTLWALAHVFREKRMLKVWAAVPSDNRLALVAARHIGMRLEGKLTKAIVREGGICDLLIFGLTRDEFLEMRFGNGAA